MLHRSKILTGLTPHQSACLDAIRTHHADKGAMPSLSELRSALGIQSKSAVHRLLRQLESRGAIKRAAGRARAIRIAEVTCPHCGGGLQ
ncbi:MAG TPA: MarR family transcriptional regulator [Rhizomicrobium sp.]